MLFRRLVPATVVLSFCALAFGLGSFSLSAQVLTVNLGATSAPVTNALVTHEQTWHWRRGTNAPPADWRTVADAELDATWTAAPGGFGYGDNAIVGEATHINPGMSNVHTTVYVRRTFLVSSDLDTNANLILTVDFDDGFVAYLDGTEIARRNVPGAPGSAVLNTATTGGVSHEASCCNSPNPAISTNFGPIANRLLPGEHVLALIGVNQEIASSDFHLIPDLTTVASVAATNVTILNLGLYGFSTTNVIVLSGSNTVAGATRVTINGDDATPSTNGTWSSSRVLQPGLNRFYVAAVDASGQIVTNLVQDVIYEASRQSIGGSLTVNSSWTDPAVVMHVTNTVVVSGATLEIGPDVVVLISPGASIIATNDASVNVAGADEHAAVFLPVDGTTWGSLMGSGSNGLMTIRHAEIVGAQVRCLNGGTVLMEDSTARELPFGTREILAAVNGGGMTVRRSHLERFTEVDAKETPVLVEDCLLQGFFIDGLDIKGTNVPLVVRGTTLRFASPTNSNADALDFGPGPAVVERCLIHDFPDKGVSIGGAPGTRISDTLIYRCGIGISAYASSDIVLVNNTVTASRQGIVFRDNPTPALGTATNLIVWGNTNNVVITNTSSLTIAFSDIEGTNYPGTANLSIDPLFINAAADDYRLAPGSPALGSGAAGANMGAPLTIGGIPAAPLRLAASVPSTNSILLNWVDDAENETGVIIQRSIDGLQWQTIGQAPANATSYSDFTAQLDQPYYYRARAVNNAGLSAFSNPTRIILPGPVSYVGGSLSGNATWSGTILVTNTVTVPGPLTLTIGPGTIVRLTNSTSISATAGGHVVVEGARDQPVIFERVNTTFNRWGDLLATGAGSTVTVRFAHLTHGRIRASSNGTALVEDSELSQLSTTGIIGGSGGALFTIRRCYVHDYEDIDLGNTRTLAEDSLFERANSDIFELQGSPAGSILRRCTFRNCLNPNSDGVDMNGCLGVLIDSCLIYNVTDKGISSGSATSASDPTSFGLVVSNSLVHSANIGIGIKDSGTASIFNSTISATTDGIAVYAKFTAQGGFVTNGANNLVWGVTNSIRATNDGTVTIRYSDLQATNWPGPGNFSADPQFWNAAAFDYRLGPASPARAAGEDRHDVGAQFPVGAPMAPSHPRIETATYANNVGTVQFWADSVKSYTLSVAETLNGAVWTTVTNVPTRLSPALIEVAIPLTPGHRFVRLQTP